MNEPISRHEIEKLKFTASALIWTVSVLVFLVIGLFAKSNANDKWKESIEKRINGVIP